MRCAAGGRPHRPGLALTAQTAPGGHWPLVGAWRGFGGQGLYHPAILGNRLRSKVDMGPVPLGPKAGMGPVPLGTAGMGPALLDRRWLLGTPLLC